MEIAPRYERRPIIELDGDLDDQRVTVARQRRRLEAALAELTDEEWRAPSRCAGWTVQDVVAHLAGVNWFWQVSIDGGRRREPTQLLVGFDPVATPEQMVAGRRALAPSETLAWYRETNDALLASIDALDGDDWAATGEAPPGWLPLRTVAHHALWDAWIHERDVLEPLGRPIAVESDEITACLRYAAAISPALAFATEALAPTVLAVEAHDPTIACTVTVGEHAVAVHAGLAADVPVLRGDAVAVVEALSLRAPLPADAPAAWHGHLAGLARAFDLGD